jgi:hypothetical protein
MEDMDISLAVTIRHSLDILVGDTQGDLRIINVFQNEGISDDMDRQVMVVLEDGQVLRVTVDQVAPPRR